MTSTMAIMERRKILFFTDDDSEDLHLMKEIADSLGHSSELFHDGHSMISRLHEDSLTPDVIFLDISMPRIDGFEVLQKIRASKEKFQQVPIVIHSSNCEESCISRCFELGANYYMTKAYSYKDLLKSLEFAMNRDWQKTRPEREAFLYVH